MKALRTFANWASEPAQVARWMSTKPLESRRGQEKELKSGMSTVDVVYRDGQFQVERIALKPHTIVKAHRHPGVDSYEYHVDGDIDFFLGRRMFHQTPETVRHMRMIPVPQFAFHAGIAGNCGATFLSIQQWKGEQSSVRDVWESEC